MSRLVPIAQSSNTSYRLPEVLRTKPGKRSDLKSEELLECGVATHATLQFGLIFGFKNGIHIDTSWRNKTPDRSPVTFVLTVDDNGHGLPVAAFVSSLADGATYGRLLSALRKALEQHAEQLVSGEAKCRIPPKLERRLLEVAKITAADGYIPQFGMMDGCDKVRIGWELAFSGVPKRLCQYHLIKALNRKLVSIYGRSDAGCASHKAAADAFRECQRCDHPKNWQAYYSKLEQVIRGLTNEGTINGDRAWKRLDEYLQKQWFHKRWRRACMDYGLPVNSVRGMANATNNYTERSFCTFDRVFLCARNNKRLDRLLFIIIHLFFRHYEENLNLAPRVAADIMEASNSGYSLWDMGFVSPIPEQRMPPQLQHQFGVAYQIRDIDDPAKVDAICGFGKVSKREYCLCEFFRKTGKRCAHLWAVLLFERLGPADNYDQEIKSLQQILKRLNQEDDDLDLEEAAVRAEEDDTDDAKDGEDEWDSDEEETREEELARFFKVTIEELADWNFLNDPIPENEIQAREGTPPQPNIDQRPDERASGDTGEETSSGGQRGRPRNTRNLAEDPPHNPDDWLLRTKLELPPPPAANPNGALCWQNALCIALAYIPTFAEHAEMVTQQSHDLALHHLRWLPHLLNHIQLLRHHSRRPVNPMELRKQLQEGLLLNRLPESGVGRQEDPNLVLGIMLNCIREAGMEKYMDIFSSTQWLQRTCSQCGYSDTMVEKLDFYVVPLSNHWETTLSGGDTASPQGHIQKAIVFICPQCSTKHDPYSPDLVTFETGNVRWTQHTYPFGRSRRPAEIPIVVQGLRKGRRAAWCLVSAIFRIGDDALSGHNLALVRRGHQWYVMNDTDVHTVDRPQDIFDLYPTCYAIATFHVYDQTAIVEMGDYLGQRPDIAMLRAAYSRTRPPRDVGQPPPPEDRTLSRLKPGDLPPERIHTPGTSEDGEASEEEKESEASEKNSSKSSVVLLGGPRDKPSQSSNTARPEADDEWTRGPSDTVWERVPSDYTRAEEDPFFSAVERHPGLLAASLLRDISDPDVGAALRAAVVYLGDILPQTRHDFLKVPVGSRWCEEPLSDTALKEAGQVIEALCARLNDMGSASPTTEFRVASERMTRLDWYSDACIFALLTALAAQPWIAENPDVRFKAPLWDGSTVAGKFSCPLVPPRARRDKPIPLPFQGLLGADAKWRTRISIMPFQPFVSHFATLVIIGPKRMIVVYDSLSSATPGRALNVSDLRACNPTRLTPDPARWFKIPNADRREDRHCWGGGQRRMDGFGQQHRESGSTIVSYK